MKKLVAIIASFVCLVPLLFCACKKNTVFSKSNEKTFARYFYACNATENGKSILYTTDSFYDLSPKAYTSLNFLADSEWTNELHVTTIFLDVFANKTADIDTILTFTTNGETTTIPVLFPAKENQTVKVSITLDKTLYGETSLLFELSNIGAKGMAEDGLLFDTNGISTGFVWKISGASLYGAHEVKL